MKIGNWESSDRVLIIAEIGNNHEGDVALASKMIDLAAESGADAVKFQTIIPENLVTSTDISRIEQLKRFELKFSDYEKLAKQAEDLGLIFLSTPFDVEGVKFLNKIVPVFKISSGDNNYFQLLKAVAATGKPIIMSTGMAGNTEIADAVRYIEECHERSDTKADLALLHCVSNYPVLPKNANLLSINKLKAEFGNHCIGYSDHCLGIEASVLAVAMGARIIEKHFTIDKNHTEFRDHQLSADPDEMTALVNRIRGTENLMGALDKKLTEEDEAMRKAARRSVAASVDLATGHLLKSDDLLGLRPGTGISVADIDKCIGKELNKDIAKGALINFSDFG